MPTVYVEDANGVTSHAWPGPSATKESYEYGIISFPIPTGATKVAVAIYGWDEDGSYDGTKAQTIDVNWSVATSDLYVLTGTNSDGKWQGTWHYTDYAAPTSSSSTLPGYYFEGGASDKDWKATSLNHMGPNTANMSDKAHIDDFTVSSGHYFKVVQIETSSTIAAYIGYDSLTAESKALKNTSGDALITDGTNHNLVFTAQETICVYLTSGGEISITANSAKASAGYLYVTGTLASITFYSYSDNGGTSEITHGSLSSVSGITTCSSAYMKNTRTLYRVPIYNLRGATATTVASYKLGSSAVTLVPTPSSENPPAVYYDGTTIYSADATAKLAKATYNIAKAIDNATDASVCNLGSATKTALLTDYATWSGSSLYGQAGVHTYSPDAEKASMISAGTKAKVALSKIVAELDGTAHPASIRIINNMDNQSPLTLALWIVLGCGLAGLGAIGTAYFVSKKKKRHTA